MYAASGILILCRWPSCALAKGNLQSPLSKCTRRPPAENENTRGCIHVQLTSLTSWRWADDARNMKRNLILCNLYKKIVYQVGINKGTPSLFNPLNSELNPICHLLELLGAHHIFHVSRLRVNLLSEMAHTGHRRHPKELRLFRPIFFSWWSRRPCIFLFCGRILL